MFIPILALLALIGISAVIASYFFLSKPTPIIVPRQIIRLPDGRLLEGPYKKLGEGAFGNVSQYQLDKKPVAVKMPIGPQYNEFQEHELKLLQKANGHQNIISFITRVDFDKKIWIVMELMKGSVRDLLDKNRFLSWATKLSIARQLMTGLVHLHNQSSSIFSKNAIVHQDLKTENLLVDRIDDNPEIKVKISDFGLAREVDQFTLPLIGHVASRLHEGKTGGTLLYMAPEVVQSMQGKASVSCDPKSDIFGAGVIMWEIATTQIPNRTRNECSTGAFNAFRQDQNNRSTIQKKSYFGGVTTMLGEPTYPKSSFFGPVIDKCINPQANKRSSAHQILQQLDECEPPTNINKV